MRLHHYSIHTERTYLDWIKRYIAFHRMKSRDDLAEPGNGAALDFLTFQDWLILTTIIP